MEVRYSREEFIKFHTGKSKPFAKEYCDNNQKETYGSEDFDACYYTIPQWAMPTAQFNTDVKDYGIREKVWPAESTFDDIIKLTEETER